MIKEMEIIYSVHISCKVWNNQWGELNYIKKIYKISIQLIDAKYESINVNEII